MFKKKIINPCQITQITDIDYRLYRGGCCFNNYTSVIRSCFRLSQRRIVSCVDEGLRICIKRK